MRNLLFSTLALLLLMTACRKEEFQQPPHGEPVPYTDTARYDLPTLLGMSGYKLFNAAWQKSTVNTRLAKEGKNMRFTIMAPDDAAMTAAGYTREVIAAATTAHLDSLVCFHIITEYIDTTALRGQLGSVRRTTMLKDAVLIESIVKPGSSVPMMEHYTYKQFLGMTADGSLLVNGKNTGKHTPLYATNGIIWPVNQLLKRPTESTLDFLRRDPRFTIFAALIQQTNDIWETEGMGYFPRTSFSGLGPTGGNEISSNAFFAPTDEAFKKAGFNSVEDLMALNARSMPYLDWDYFEMINGFVTDSLLAFHEWGRMYTPTEPAYGAGYGAPAMFFSNDLDNRIIGKFDLTTSSGGRVPPYTMPLNFGNSGGKITVQVKGSSHPGAAIEEADIMTFQGPVHVMENLILSDKVKY
ncbi:Fasciclin domain-containing protein [Chitinophaga jiangningensis]|uniref:Fasciclin domain-containing protein n=1 Tax=Chitinophaga jiangningensis TaxID=1419482 RepID=A0A1M7J3V0_9BACT|nr:fasciclin domain-containing protein [Chitinophaga jiangningensis]SHM47790.1 Fasciclin domain-containing protein [Chitinophaga jiangningensis]